MRGRALCRGLFAAALAVVGPLATAYTLDIDSTSSIMSTAKSMTEDLMSFYSGDQKGQIPGMLPFPPYYWWESGAMWGCMIDYWYYTRDTTWNQQVIDGLIFQVGPNKDYMPPNQTMTEGNDDQGFWGLTVMSAAEYNFPNPPADQPQWLELAQAVFNTQAARWDTANCNGGLRWQIFEWNNGYDYKNSISQACFFALSARLALYTGNSSYGDWAERTWDWMVGTKFIDDDYYIYDGAHIETNCTPITPYQWTYNAGGFILGAAAMYNLTGGAEPWATRLDGLVKGAGIFFNNASAANVMVEVACESVGLCDLDQHSFKAYLARWLAASTKWAPHISATVTPWLRASAVAAAAQCTGGSNGKMCGLVWTGNGKWDGSTGPGQQMAAMEVVLANMIGDAAAPVTAATGGNSTGDAGAGSQDIGHNPSAIAFRRITAADEAGAWILTLLALACLVTGVVFLLLDETSAATPKEQGRAWLAALAAAVSGAGAGAAALRKRRPGGIYTEKTAPGAFDASSLSGASSRSFPALAAVARPRGSRRLSGRASQEVERVLPTHHVRSWSEGGAGASASNPGRNSEFTLTGWRGSGPPLTPVVPLTARERRLSMPRDGYARRIQRRSGPPIYE